MHPLSAGKLVVSGELIEGYPAADDREQIGRFFEHAFPIDPTPFTDLFDEPADKPAKELAHH